MFASKSTDCGVSWTRYYLAGVGHTYSLAVDPTNTDIVYAGGNPGIFKTTDGGDSWTDITSGITDYVMAIAINPQNPAVLYAGTRDGVFKSTNSGADWTNTGLSEVNTLVIDPACPDTVYAGTNSGVYIRTSQTNTWQVMNDGLGDTVITRLDIDPGNYLYASTSGAGMYSWSLNTGVQEHRLTRINGLLEVLPNPTQKSTCIKYQLFEDADVNLKIYDIQGRSVKTIVAGRQKQGIHRFVWNGVDDDNRSCPAGVYFCRMVLNARCIIKKIIML